MFFFFTFLLGEAETDPTVHVDSGLVLLKNSVYDLPRNILKQEMCN